MFTRLKLVVLGFHAFIKGFWNTAFSSSL